MSRHGIWFVAGGCATALAILVVILFFIPSAAPPPPVTIESIDWQIAQTPPVNGTPEFAELWINQSGPVWGFPFQIRAGGSFNDSLVIVNDEPRNVYICGASIAPPLYIVSTNPTFPMVATLEEDNLLILTLSVHATAGASVNEAGVINALGCGLPSSSGS
ncbi:MAG: hypothetical protein L3K02_05955 [Thermoplasmata archaeon]|nr:hypothetical protein [Thermoplasmata archaeon]